MNGQVEINDFTSRSKRLVDLVIASLGLLVTLPLWLVIALLIRLDSAGPVFFTQLRIGKAHTDRTLLFNIIKFRTMVDDAERSSGAVWATINDPRVTRVGYWLRRCRLDELPQFINVLCGDMSLVGPRPERPGFYRQLERQIPFFCDRTFGVLPGITGLAQVSQVNNTGPGDSRVKVLFDHRYAIALANPVAWFKMDLNIILRTVSIVLMGRGV